MRAHAFPANELVIQEGADKRALERAPLQSILILQKTLPMCTAAVEAIGSAARAGRERHRIAVFTCSTVVLVSRATLLTELHAMYRNVWRVTTMRFPKFHDKI